MISKPVITWISVVLLVVVFAGVAAVYVMGTGWFMTRAIAADLPRCLSAAIEHSDVTSLSILIRAVENGDPRQRIHVIDKLPAFVARHPQSESEITERLCHVVGSDSEQAVRLAALVVLRILAVTGPLQNDRINACRINAAMSAIDEVDGRESFSYEAAWLLVIQQRRGEEFDRICAKRDILGRVAERLRRTRGQAEEDMAARLEAMLSSCRE